MKGRRNDWFLCFSSRNKLTPLLAKFICNIDVHVFLVVNISVVRMEMTCHPIGDLCVKNVVHSKNKIRRIVNRLNVDEHSATLSTTFIPWKSMGSQISTILFQVFMREFFDNQEPYKGCAIRCLFINPPCTVLYFLHDNWKKLVIFSNASYKVRTKSSMDSLFDGQGEHLSLKSYPCGQNRHEIDELIAIC